MSSSCCSCSCWSAKSGNGSFLFRPGQTASLRKIETFAAAPQFAFIKQAGRGEEELPPPNEVTQFQSVWRRIISN